MSASAHERYAALLLASLPPKEQRKKLALVPSGERQALTNLLTQIPKLGDYKLFADLLSTIPPPQPDELAPLRQWGRKQSEVWSQAVIRSLITKARHHQKESLTHKLAALKSELQADVDGGFAPDWRSDFPIVMAEKILLNACADRNFDSVYGALRASYEIA